MNTKNIKLYERIMNIVLDILIFIFGIILLISIYNGIQVKILGNKYSSFFGYSIFEVQTGSMADTINVGDWIIVKKSQNVELDDIITFEEDGEYVTHRVKEIYKNTYVTKGDANSAKDKPIAYSQVVGRVTKILPNFGILRKTLFNPIVLITLIITIYIFSFLFRKNKKNDEKGENIIIKKLDIILDLIIENFKHSVESKSIEKKDKKIDMKTENIKVDDSKLDNIKVEKIRVEPEHEQNIKYEQVNNENQNDNSNLHKENIESISDEDLDKTMYFRAIKVDKSELDKTYLKIKEQEIIDGEKEEKEKSRLEKKKEKEKLKNEENIEIDDSLIKDKLELLQKKNSKKFKNIIDKIMYLKEQELEEIVEVLNNNEKLLVNEATIRSSFIKAYVDVKYYNYCGNINAEYNGRNMTVKIVDTIKEFSEQLVNNYKGPDKSYEEKVKKYTNIFILIMYLEQANGKIDDLEPVKEMYKKKIMRYSKDDNVDEKTVKVMIDEIIKNQRLYQGMINYSLKKLDTNTFNLNLHQVANKKQLYALELEHNITFSKVYSDYIIDKTYKEGVIAEDKVIIEMTLASIKLVTDMLNSSFNKKYILYVPETIYSKENKLNKLLSMMEDEYAKNNIFILVKFKSLVKNIKLIKELKKSGYRFVLVFDENIDIKTRERSYINIAEYVFINKKAMDPTNIIANIPEDLINNIIYDDIGSKVGNYGGE